MKQLEKTRLTKERILSAALAEFGLKGYGGAAINDICSGHQISKGLVYHNFENKDALYLHCVTQVLQTFLTFMGAQIPQDGLLGYLDLRCRFFAEHPLHSRIFFEAILQPPRHLADSIATLKAPLDAFNLEVYRRALGEMRLRPGVTMEEALSYFSLMQEIFNGYFSSTAYGGETFSELVADHEHQLTKILDLMLYGIVQQEVRA